MSSGVRALGRLKPLLLSITIQGPSKTSGKYDEPEREKQFHDNQSAGKVAATAVTIKFVFSPQNSSVI